MSDPKTDLKKTSAVIGLNPAMVDEDTSVNAKIVLMLTEQNLLRESTNAKLFDGLDKASAAAELAVKTAEEAKAHGEAVLKKLNFQDEKILGPIREDIAIIKQTTTETNGKVKVLRADVDPLLNERKKRLQTEEDNRLRREGLLVLPRTMGVVIFWVWEHMAKPTMKTVAIFATGIVVYEWFWNHRFFLVTGGH